MNIPIPGLSQAKFYAILTALAVTIVGIGGVVWYINVLEKKLDTLKTNNQILNDAVDRQAKTLASMERDFGLIRESQNVIAGRVQAGNNDLAGLRKRFEQDAAGQPRDLGAVAIKDPEGVSRAVNRGVAEANRCLEVASGAPLTEKEKNAKLKTEINSICPSLINPSYKPGN